MKDWQGTPEEFLAWTEREDKQIIVYGAGRMAEELLGNPRFAKRVRYFVDKDPNKQKYRLREDIPVYGPEHLRKEDFSQAVLLIASGWFREILQDLSGRAEMADVFCAAYPLMLASYRAGSEEFFRERIVAECLKEYAAILRQKGSVDAAERERLLAEEKAYIMGNGDGERPLVLPRVMLLPTTRCNLRCKGCSSLLPMFEHPEDVPIWQNIRDMEDFFRHVDQCIRLTIGGEPFLYPELAQLLRYLQRQEKVLGVLLITNSTVQPSKEVLEILCDPKFYVEVSDYGHIQQMSRTVAALEAAGVNFCVLTDQVWDDMGGIELRGRTPEQRKEVFMNCEQGRIMKALHHGFLYVCARSARMRALDCGYASEQDYFSLQEPDLRDRIRAIYGRDCADACDRCDLGYRPNRKIPAGIQLKGNMRKSAYTLVRREEYEALKQRLAEEAGGTAWN